MLAVFLVATYFRVEFVHYDIRRGKLRDDGAEYRRVRPAIVAGLVMAVVVWLGTIAVG